MKNSMIIVKKQLMDTLKNKTILIQFILFPIMTLIMENAIQLEGMPEHFFTKLFSIMYIGMAPLTSVAAIISEEKEKNTLRVLLMANIKPWQYLTGIGMYVWSICMMGAGVMATGLPKQDMPIYLLIMAIGFVISILVGACIGIYAKDQMSGTSLVMPIMMVLSFLPMLAMFNEKIEKMARFFFTQQLKLCLNDMSLMGHPSETYIVLFVNIIIAMLIFGITFKKKGLE
ncbi:MAG: ABC transporter permease [Lachnospiraceae bacterium]|nr:ABC transporter permease [Lachnospiraceae bacterium]